MKKISLALLLLCSNILGAFAQSADTSAEHYKSRKLKLSEVNLVSSYYSQDGDNSAVTGGVGSEQLTDFANNLELKFVKPARNEKTHTFTLDVGIDHYSSASSDKIDPTTMSSASSADTRIYPSLNWSLKDDKHHSTFGAGIYYSTEYDYKSFGLGLNFAKASQDNNREFSAHLQAYWDTWHVILPVELRTTHGKEETNQPRNSYSASFSLSQVVNPRLQLALLADVIYQQGLLATKYQRVYFNDFSELSETLPDTRLKIPLGIRAHYFLGDRYVLRGYYRFYFDDWGLSAHTLSAEVAVKINPFLSVSPFYRFYTQTAVKYFAPYGRHNRGETYYSSDYDLSNFVSHFFGVNLRWVPENGVLRIKHFTSAELRYGHYMRDTPLTSDIITLALGFK